MLLQGVIACFALTLAAVKTADVQFNTAFPKDLNLLKGDVIELKLSNYVNKKGAKFDTNPSSPEYFVPSISYLGDTKLNTPQAQRCTLVIPYVDSKVLMVCMEKYFIVASMDHILRQTKGSQMVELVSDVPSASQRCTDLTLDSNIAYISCLDSSKFGQTDTDVAVVIYKVQLGDTLAVSNSKCNTKMVSPSLRMTFIRPKNKPLEVIFLNPMPLPGVASSLKVTRCKNIPTDASNNTHSTSLTEDIVTILGDEAKSLNATIKHIHQLNDNDILFALSESTESIKRLTFIILNYNSDGSQFAKSLFQNTSYNPGSMRGAFNPANLAITIESDSAIAIVSMADLRMSYKLPVFFDKLSDPEKYKINIGIPAFSPIDCGYGAEESSIYASRIRTYANDSFLHENLRQVVEYRSRNDALDLKGFVINYYQSEYACSENGNAPHGKVHYGITLLGLNTGFATGGDNDNMTYYSIQPRTLLRVDTSKLSEGQNTIKVVASLKGYTNGEQELKFTLSSDYRDPLNVSLTSNTITSYSDSRFTLPYVAENFIGNNLQFSTNATNVVQQYATVFYPILDITDLGGYIIDKTFAVDHDTFVAVLTKPLLPNKYLTYFGKIEAGKMTLELNSLTAKETPGIALFKIFKLGNDLYCMVFKSQSTSQKRVTVSCFEDKPDGIQKLTDKEISNQYEIMDIQFLETSQRVDMLMIAAVTEQKRQLTKLLHFYIKLNPDKSIWASPPAREISLNHPALSSYVPIDVLFDYVADLEASNHVTIKMISSNAYPIIAKFNMTFQGENVELHFLRFLNIKTNDVAYCVNRQEAILFNRKTRQLYAQRFDIKGSFPDSNAYMFPHKELGIQYIIQFLCIPEKGIFQILGVDSSKKKYVVTYRGGESPNLGRRVHSMVQVDDSVDFIEHGYTKDYIVTVAGGSGGVELKRAYIQVFPDGPFFHVDNKDKTESYWVGITVKNDKTSLVKDVRVEIVQPKYSADVKLKSPFEIKPGAIMFVEDYAEVSGPVMDIQLVGEAKDLEQIQVIKRNNKHKGLNIGTNDKPDKVLVKGDFLVTLNFDSYIKFFGDPTVVQKGATQPYLIHTENCNVKDAVIGRRSSTGLVAVVVKEFKDGEFVYSLTILRKLKDNDGNDAFIREPQGKVYSTKEDYEDLQMTFLEDDLIVSMKSKKELISNYIKLLAFKQETGGYNLVAATNVMTLNDRAITSYSLVFIGSKSVAIIAATQGETGLQAAIWDTFANYLVLVETTTQIEVEPEKFRYVQIDYLRCWTGPTGTSKVQCVFDSEGITDLLAEITFNPLFEVNNLDRITKIKILAQFEMPPYFNIKKTSRDGNYFTFLIEKNQASKIFANRRLLQGATTVDKWTDCNQLIVVYKPFASKYIYTAITCSEWNNAPTTDLCTENIGGRSYIFYPKVAPKDTSKVAPGVLNERLALNYISGIVLQFKNAPIEQSKVSLKFIGLNGQAGSDNKEFRLDQFKKPEQSGDSSSGGSSKAWIWILIIVVVLLAVGAGVFLFLRSRSSASVGSGSYKQDADSSVNNLNSKDDLEDVRL